MEDIYLYICIDGEKGDSDNVIMPLQPLSLEMKVDWNF